MEGKDEEEREKLLSELDGATAEAEREALRAFEAHMAAANGQ